LFEILSKDPYQEGQESVLGYPDLVYRSQPKMICLWLPQLSKLSISSSPAKILILKLIIHQKKINLALFNNYFS